jgi:hypothetical protein
LQALLVVDESLSLRDNDPQDRRAAILADVITSLGGLSTQNLTSSPRRVDVAVSTFATGYTPWIPWTTLSPAKADALANQVRREIPSRDAGQGTNHPAALSGGRNTLAQGASRFTAEAAPCKIMIFFTDGKLDISGDDAVNDAAAVKMCQSRGVVTGLRNDGVNIATIFLSNPNAPDQPGLRKGSQLLRAIAEGSGGGTPSTCGVVPIPASASRGVFLEGSADALSQLFGTVIAISAGGTEIPGVSGSPVNLRVDKGVSAFRVIAPASKGFALADPSGASLTVPVNGPGGNVGSSAVAVSWVGTTATINVPISSQTGNWVLTRPSQSKAFSFFLFSGLQISLDDERLVLDEPARITGRVQDANGQPVDLSQYAEAQIKGSTLVDGGQGSPIPLTLNSDGTFVGDFTPQGDSTTVNFEISLDLTTRDIVTGQKGQQLAQIVRTFVEPVRLPDVFPVIETSTLSLSPLEGKKGVAKGELNLKGSPKGASKVCLGDVTFIDVDQPGNFTVTGSRSCVDLAVDEAKSLPIEVRNAVDPVDGQVNGTLPLDLTSAATPTASAVQKTQVVPLTFVSLRPVNNVVRFGLFALLLALGLLLPLMFLWFLNKLNAKLVIDTSRLNVAKVGVRGRFVEPEGMVTFTGTLTAFVAHVDLTKPLDISKMNDKVVKGSVLQRALAELCAARNVTKIPVDGDTDPAGLVLERESDDGGAFSFNGQDFSLVSGQIEKISARVPMNPFGTVHAVVEVGDGRYVVSSVDPISTSRGTTAGMTLDPSNQFYLDFVITSEPVDVPTRADVDPAAATQSAAPAPASDGWGFGGQAATPPPLSSPPDPTPQTPPVVQTTPEAPSDDTSGGAKKPGGGDGFFA